MVQQFPVADTHAPVVNNFNYNYSPVDSRQNITTNNQQYHTDNSHHQTTNAPYTIHTTNNQRDIINNSRRDTITQSMDNLHLDSSSGPKNQRQGVAPPSESIALRGPLIKCKRGLFFDKGVTTHQHVPDNRSC